MKIRTNPLPIVCFLCAVSVAVMLLTLMQTGRKPEFSPPPFESAAQTGVPEVPEGLGYRELDALVFRASLCGEIRITGNAADIWLTNPKSNSVWLKLRIMDANGTLLGETGILRPGEYVQQVTLDPVPETETPVLIKLMAYEPETYHSAGAVTVTTAISPG